MSLGKLIDEFIEAEKRNRELYEMKNEASRNLNLVKHALYIALPLSEVVVYRGLAVSRGINNEIRVQKMIDSD